MSVLMWTAEQKARVAQAIAKEIERARTSHKFVDAQKVSESSRTVPANTFVPGTGGVDDGNPLPVIELFVQFPLTKLQSEDPNLDSALTSVTRAAAELARGHDGLVFIGAIPAGNRCAARHLPAAGIENLRARGAAAGTQNVNRAAGARGAPGTYAEDMIAKVSAGRAQLDGAGFSGGYVMVMGTTFFAEANMTNPGSSERPIKVIEGIIEGSIHSSSVIPADEALLIAATPDAVDRAVASEPSLDYASVTIDANDQRQCRLYERFIPRLKDPRCVVHFRLA